MKNEIEKTETIIESKDFEVLVDPSIFGLEVKGEERVPVTDILDYYNGEFNEIINNKNNTPELCERASVLRKKIVKVRTTATGIFKEKKEYWLRGGQSVDRERNKALELFKEREEKLYEIETAQQRIEQERIQKLTAERIDLLKQYDVDGTLIPTISVMGDDLWETYLIGVKANYQAKKEAEQKAELERQAQAKADQEKIDAQKIENERLIKEAKQKEIERQAEQKKQADILAKQKAESDAKLKKEREAKAKIEAELQAKKDAEAKAIADEEARIEAEANMGDKGKIQALINYLNEGKIKFSFKSKSNQKKYEQVGQLIDKIIEHVKK